MNPMEIDTLLLPYCQATEEEEAQRIVTQLVTEQITPLVNGIIWHKLGLWLRPRRDEAEDVHSEILLQLLYRLNALRQGHNETPITNLRAYVAVTSYRGCAAYLRRRYPNRWRLLNRVRYLLKSQPQFALRQDENEEWLGGLDGWDRESMHPHRLNREQVRQLMDGPLPQPLLGIPDVTCKRVRLDQQVKAIFDWAARYIGLDELVAVLAHWWGVSDQVAEAELGRRDLTINIEDRVGQRLYLEKLWPEIAALPLRQRQALLLNLRDTGNQDVIMLLPALQIASVRHIAAVLELSAEEFAALWPRLPLDDNEIAQRMNITRRQVINLRKTARERLLRRTRNW